MKFAFKATTTIAVFSLVFIAFAPAALAFSGTIRVVPNLTMEANLPYSVHVDVIASELEPGANVGVVLTETNLGAQTTYLGIKDCPISQSKRCEAVWSINGKVIPNTSFAYQAFINPARENVSTSVVVVKIVSQGTAGGTTPIGGPLKGENLPDKGAPILFGISTGGTELKDFIVKIGNWVFIFLIAVASVLLIVAGFLFITAAGDAEKLKKAKEMLVNSLVGVVIALLARGIVQVIQSIIGTGTGA